MQGRSAAGNRDRQLRVAVDEAREDPLGFVLYLDAGEAL